MKALILTCNTGEGHNSTATAIEQALAAHGEACDCADTLSFLSRFVSPFARRAHNQLYRHMPRAFDAAYRTIEGHAGAFRNINKLYYLIARGTDKLYRFIQEGGYDTVICTHVFSAIQMSALQEKYPDCGVHCSFVATDYTCSPVVCECRMHAFFIPDASLTEEFVSKGVPAERICATGLPVRAAFLERLPREQAAEKCGLPGDKRQVLLMCGSMGCGPMEELTVLLSERLPDDVMLTVICGTNDSLRGKLTRRFEGRDNVVVEGFVKDIPTRMDCTDLYLTKPGGISVTEAAIKGLPMVLVNAVAGCEEYNLQYCLKQGVAQTAATPKEICEICVALLSDETALASMREQSAKCAHNDAAERMYACLSARHGM